MIEVRSLTKTFGGRPVLRDLDFFAFQGEFVALLGPNGSGKTTFLRILASLSRPTFGQVRIAGHVLPAQAAGVRRRLGFVSHQPLLYGDLSAEENLRFFGRMYGVEGLRERVQDALTQVGLLARRRDLVRGFSRGMQQRLAIARALLHHPDLLLFDEPHTGLDPEASAVLDRLLLEVAAQGHTILLTSHDLSRASALAGRLDILSGGKIAGSAKREEISPADFPRYYESILKVREEPEITE